ncbi:MAG: hypothetical protein J7559_01565 [Cohnella sp.]|nr:hypothetical protein [Cohnella sp.]
MTEEWIWKADPGRYIVFGDLMVDEYETGDVTRISPEAPVPVMDFKMRRRVPGGAANVSMNLRGLGNHVEMIGVVGNDESGDWLIAELKRMGIGTAGIIRDETRPTTRKVRFSTNQQTMLRVDYEVSEPVGEEAARRICDYMGKSLHNHNHDGVLVSDYRKGLLSAGSGGNDPVSQLLNELCRHSVYTGVDTKKTGEDLGIFAGFDFIKPNLSELAKAVDLKVRVTDDSLVEAAGRYLAFSRAKSVLVTLGADGMFHYDGQTSVRVPSVKANVYDVTGAGDTVFAVAMHLMRFGLGWKSIMRLANLAASVVIETRGTKAISLQELYGKVDRIIRYEPGYFVD